MGFEQFHKLESMLNLNKIYFKSAFNSFAISS